MKTRAALLGKPAALLLLALSASSCGKRGALVYPEMGAPAAPQNVSARQTGNQVRLMFGLPQKDLAGRPLSGLAGVTIYRQEQQGAPCSTCSGADLPPYRTIHLDYPGVDIQMDGGRIIMSDGRVDQGMSYLYSLQGFLANGTPGAFSPPVAISLHPVPPSPVLRATGTPTEVRLTMTAAAPTAGTAAGFAIYRTVKGTPFSATPLASVPGPEYLDFAVQRGTTYVYAARSVVRYGRGEPVEGLPSEKVEARLTEE